MLISEQVQLIANHRGSHATALDLAWRCALDSSAVTGWQNTPKTVIRVYHHVYILLRRTRLLAKHRSLMAPVIVDHLRWICRATGAELRRLLRLMRDLFGARGELIQRALLHSSYPKICTFTTRERDNLAQYVTDRSPPLDAPIVPRAVQINVPLAYIATIKAR